MIENAVLFAVLAVCIGLFAAGGYMAWKEDQNDYDEMQERIRGRIYRNSFRAVIAMGTAAALVSDLGGRLLLEGYTLLLAVVIAGVGIFAVQCARYGVMYGFRKMNVYPRVQFATWGAIGLMMLTDAVEGGVFEKEHILRSGFVYGSLLLIICVSGLIAVAIYRKESAGENANV